MPLTPPSPPPPQECPMLDEATAVELQDVLDAVLELTDLVEAIAAYLGVVLEA